MQFPLLLLCWNALIPVRLTHNISSGKLKHALKSRITTGDPGSLALARDVDVTGQRRGVLKDTRACFIAEPCSAIAAAFERPRPRGQHKGG
ncbi:uncharacterized [Tachysurus ichikawai]